MTAPRDLADALEQLERARETIRGYEGAIEGLTNTIGEQRQKLDGVRACATLLRRLAETHRDVDTPYMGRIYDETATALERLIGDRT